MPGPDNPEEPKPNDEKPQNGGGFGWYKPPEDVAKPLSEPDESSDSTTYTPESDQEKLFRAAAIKCSQMEEELADLIHNHPSTHPSEETYIRNYGDTWNIESFDSNILGVENGQLEGQARINFCDGVSNHAQKIGIDTNKELLIGRHTDDKTRHQFEEYAQKNPDMASNFHTFYYFTPEGNYGKVSTVWPASGIRLNDQHPLFTAPRAIGYKTEMTAEDFELAGRALQILINRLKPQGEQEATSEINPE